MSNTKIASTLARTVNGVAVDDLFKTVDAIKATPAIAKFKFRIRNQWVDAGQNTSTANTFYGAGQPQSRTMPLCGADEPPVLLGGTPPPARRTSASRPCILFD
jgi:hypothetical protein